MDAIANPSGLAQLLLRGKIDKDSLANAKKTFSSMSQSTPPSADPSQRMEATADSSTTRNEPTWEGRYDGFSRFKFHVHTPDFPLDDNGAGERPGGV